MTKNEMNKIHTLMKGASREELNTMVSWINEGRQVNARKIKASLNIGDKVQFTLNNSGRIVTAIIEKINQKTIQVVDAAENSSTRWRVSPTLLSKA